LSPFYNIALIDSAFTVHPEQNGRKKHHSTALMTCGNRHIDTRQYRADAKYNLQRDGSEQKYTRSAQSDV
jgi:hypothetical protein